MHLVIERTMGSFKKALSPLNIILLSNRMPAVCLTLILTATFAQAQRQGIVTTGDFSPCNSSQYRTGGNDPASNSSIRYDIRSSPSPRVGPCAGRAFLDQANQSSEAVINTDGQPYAEANTEYWYGWSLFVPTNFDHDSPGDTVTQFHRGGTNGKIQGDPTVIKMYSSNGKWRFILTFQPNSNDENSRQTINYDFGSLAQDKGKWTDFIVHVKWTHTSAGFLEIYKTDRSRTDGKLKREVYKTGSNWFNFPALGLNDRGPFFKYGLYQGRPNWGRSGQTQTLYMDELRIGNASSSCNDVAPGTFSGSGNTKCIVP